MLFILLNILFFSLVSSQCPPTICNYPPPTFFPTLSTTSPTASPTNPTLIPSSQPTDYPSPSPSPAPTAAPSPEPTEDPSPSPSPSPTEEPTPSPTPAPTSAPSPEPTEEPTPSPTPAPTSAPSPEPTEEPSPPPTPAPTGAPSPEPTEDPSPSPSPSPTEEPTPSPTPAPTSAPSPEPTEEPTPAPTAAPSSSPSPEPTEEPTPAPTPAPTTVPSNSPTGPSIHPTSVPTNVPSTPTIIPTGVPSVVPSLSPSGVPSITPTGPPTGPPTGQPTGQPTMIPTDFPSDIPSDMPSDMPSDIPSNVPSDVPSVMPTKIPSKIPSGLPSMVPSELPSLIPSEIPSIVASFAPTGMPIDEIIGLKNEKGSNGKFEAYLRIGLIGISTILLISCGLLVYKNHKIVSKSNNLIDEPNYWCVIELFATLFDMMADVACIIVYYNLELYLLFWLSISSIVVGYTLQAMSGFYYTKHVWPRNANYRQLSGSNNNNNTNYNNNNYDHNSSDINNNENVELQLDLYAETKQSWINKYGSLILILTMFTGFFNAVQLCKSRVFSLQFGLFALPLTGDEYSRSLKYKFFFMTLGVNVPQLVGQLAYFYHYSLNSERNVFEINFSSFDDQIVFISMLLTLFEMSIVIFAQLRRLISLCGKKIRKLAMNSGDSDGNLSYDVETIVDGKLRVISNELTSNHCLATKKFEQSIDKIIKLIEKDINMNKNNNGQGQLRLLNDNDDNDDNQSIDLSHMSVECYFIENVNFVMNEQSLTVDNHGENKNNDKKKQEICACFQIKILTKNRNESEKIAQMIAKIGSYGMGNDQGDQGTFLAIMQRVLGDYLSLKQIDKIDGQFENLNVSTAIGDVNDGYNEKFETKQSDILEMTANNTNENDGNSSIFIDDHDANFDVNNTQMQGNKSIQILENAWKS